MEIINPNHQRGPFKAALFDFDGTLSLLRRGWESVMVPMMVESLIATGTQETPEQLTAIVADAVSRLTGKQTIFQMLWLAEEIKERGGIAQDPLVYKQQFLDRLIQLVRTRPRDETAIVPGCLEYLASLAAAGTVLYLASGTDVDSVREEAAALGLAKYFGDRIYGARGGSRSCAKALLLGKLGGEGVAVFGDGPVEMIEARKVGALAVGIASNEESRQGVNEHKRRRLIEAGADLVAPDFLAISLPSRDL